jgi:hypothetical protein
MINGCGEGPDVRGSNPVWSFVDLAGNQFDDTFYMWVLENDVPYIPATVWHDPAGTLPWTNPIQFLANGTLPIDIYWDPSKFYRLEFRHNVGPLPPSQADPLIYLVENYSPNNAPMTPVGGDGFTTDNQIANPQFANMSSPNPYVLTAVTNPPPIEVAPGWFLDLVGTGSATIERIPLNTAISTPTNAPYALHINLTGGWTGQPVLRQRFQQNGQNWRNKNLSASVTARINGITAPFLVRADASNGQPLGIIINDFLINTFEEFTGTIPVAAYANLDLPPNAYIDFKVLLPATGDMYFTSFQLIVSDVAAPFSYEQITVDRQIDHLFHYYQPKIQYMPIPSYLVGWDFPLNPAQINGDALAAQATAINQGYYAWDQTIIYQTAVSSVTTARGVNGSLQLTCAVAGQVALIQYLDQVQARKILSDRASVHLSLFGSLAGGGHGNVTLWATTDATLPALPNTFVTTLDADGKPATVSSVNWVQVPNLYQNTRFTVPAISATNAESNDINLNGWDLAGAVPVNTATFFAIVVGFSPWAVADILNINSIALCAGDIATRPAPKTQAETLIACQRFYEKSYSQGVVAGTVSDPNSIVKAQSAWLQAGVAYRMVATSFSLDYQTEKRTATPSVHLYNPVTGTIDSVRGYVFGAGSAAAGQGNLGAALWVANANTKTAYYLIQTYDQTITEGSFAGAGWAEGNIRFHYVADARLGVVN